MKLLIEPFTSLLAWSSDGSASAWAINELPDYVSGRLGQSVVFQFPTGNLGKYITKVTAFDVTGYTELVLCLWSRNRRRDWFLKPTDFSYKISVDATHEFYLPTFQGFCDVTISLSGITAIDRVRITALHDEEDYLVCSGLYAIRDEYPLDVLQAIQDELEILIADQYPDGILVGTLVGDKYDESVVIGGYRDFLDRYALIKIKQGATSETHQLRDFDESKWTFYGNLDGVALKNTFTAAEVYLQFPVRITLGETDALYPSISLQGMEPQPILRSSGTEQLVDTFGVEGTFKSRRDDLLLQYPILIDCEARHYEILAQLNRIARGFLGQYKLWINGRKHDFVFDIPPRQLDPTIPIEVLPKTQYTVNVEVKELREAREVLPIAGSATATFNLQAPGVLPVTTPPEVPSDSLEAYWSFDGESLADSSGNGHDLISASNVSFVSGISGLAVKLLDNSVLRYLSTAPTFDLSLKSAFSLSMWASKFSAIATNGYLFSMYTANACGFLIYAATSSLQISIAFYRAGASELVNTGIYLDNTLRHYVLTLDRTTKAWVLYRDGIWAAGGTLTNTPVLPISNRVILGNYEGLAPVNTWNGIVDEVRFYTRVLTVVEAAAIYAFDRS